MSDNWICIIPEQPDFVPDEERQQQAVSYFRTICARTTEVRVSVNDRIVFFDCGANFESVTCPSCETNIDIESWQGWMNEDFDGEGFTLTGHTMPCCGAQHNLHELRYEMPQGFGRFELSAMNRNLGELSEEQHSQFEQILGCRVRIIYRHL